MATKQIPQSLTLLSDSLSLFSISLWRNTRAAEMSLLFWVCLFVSQMGEGNRREWLHFGGCFSLFFSLSGLVVVGLLDKCWPYLWIRNKYFALQSQSLSQNLFVMCKAQGIQRKLITTTLANKRETWTSFKCDSVLFNVWLNKNLQATGEKALTTP